jgi:LCP family protein required for cell wall assembly
MSDDRTWHPRDADSPTGAHRPDDDNWSPRADPRMNPMTDPRADPRMDPRVAPRAIRPLGDFEPEQDNRPPRRRNGGKKKRSRARTIAKWTSISLASVLVLALAGAAYIYKTTIGDIKHTALLPNGVTQSALPADPFGDTAMNILLIGSDTRDSAGDCNLGGDCAGGPTAGANADAEIILHVSADRTNATVMSIPRDTETTLPQCKTDSSGSVTVTGSYQGQINSALQGGPECQVAADHQLTGITITGYIMFDFDGVVSMSNALGGVPVCVTKAVHDTNSGLQLPAGTNTVQGNQALEFLRTRDSFFDGSDLGREQTTHYFFTQMIQSVRGDMNLGDVTTLLSIGRAMASSTTVSDNFSGLGNLEGLVESLDKIPNKAITFVTMPWNLDPGNSARVVTDQPAADQMFQNIQNDVSYTDNGPAKSATATTAPTTAPAIPQAPADVNKADVHVSVYNADGVTGRAGAVTAALTSAGFEKATSSGDLSTATTTEIYYPAGDSAQADAVAATLRIPTAQIQQSSTYSQVAVVVGADFETGSTYAGSTATIAGDTAGAPTAPANSGEMNADSTGECIPVESGTLAMAHQ